jgi:hypothetical protein
VDARLATEQPEYIYTHAQKTAKGYNLGPDIQNNQYYQLKNLDDIKEYEESKNININYNSEYVTYLKSK